MRALLCSVFLLFTLVPAHGAITMAVNQQSGKSVQDRAEQLARLLGSELGTVVNVVSLPDAVQVEAWLNRYATAELALVESGYVSGKPGQFVVIGSAGQGLTLIGRQGISGDLPQKIAGILDRGGVAAPVPPPKSAAVATVQPPPVEPRPAARTVLAPAMAFTPSKSAEEDRYFVGYVYRKKLGIEPELVRLDYWTQQLQSGALTKQQLFEMACHPETVGCDFR